MMPNASLMELGAGGILVVAILKLVFDFAKNRTQSNLESAIEKVAEATEKVTKVLTDLSTQSQIHTEVIRRLSEDVRDVRRNINKAV
jgi:C4-type Zn-finger protein